MSHFFITVGAAIAVLAIAAPIGAAFLVSVASRREESEHSLSGQAPGPITRAARRLLAYKSQTGTASAPTTGDQLRARRRSPATRGRVGQSGPRHAPSAIAPVTISLAPDTGRDAREPAGTRAA